MKASTLDGVCRGGGVQGAGSGVRVGVQVVVGTEEPWEEVQARVRICPDSAMGVQRRIVLIAMGRGQVRLGYPPHPSPSDSPRQ